MCLIINVTNCGGGVGGGGGGGGGGCGVEIIKQT